jgi:hypothetical protein
MATERSTTKKSATKKSTGDQSADGSVSPAKRAPAKKVARKRAPSTEAPRRKSGTAIAAEAAQQLLEVTGREVEGITALEKSDDGWRVQVEVLEVRRIPDTTDILALYDLEVGSDGELNGYRRVERYVRGAPGEGARS